MSVILTAAGAPIQTVTTATAGAGNAATFPFEAAPSLTMMVDGTFSATLTFEGTIDQHTWFGVGATKLADGTTVATTTGTGLFAFTNTGLAAVRARCSAFTSGAADISAGRGLW